MTVGAESITMDEWLYARLSADNALLVALGVDLMDPPDMLPVYGYEAPPEALLPFVIFNFQSGVDVNAIATEDSRIMVSALYQVKAVAEGPSFKAMGSIVAAMDAAISGNGGTTPTGEVFGCKRESSVVYPEPPGTGGRQFRHLGGLYRIFAQ